MERGCPQSGRERGLTMLLITLAGTIKAPTQNYTLPGGHFFAYEGGETWPPFTLQQANVFTVHIMMLGRPHV